MPTISTLTEEQFKNLLDDYFAKPEKRSMLTPTEIKDLANRLNEKVNVPIINETGEQKIFVKIVVKIDTFLYDNLPNEFYDLIRSLDNGIDDDEAKRLIKRLAKLANKNIDIPYIPESLEYLAIRFILGTIINAARKAWDFDSAIEHDMSIPANAKATDHELESIIN